MIYMDKCFVWIWKQPFLLQLEARRVMHVYQVKWVAKLISVFMISPLTLCLKALSTYRTSVQMFPKGEEIQWGKPIYYCSSVSRERECKWQFREGDIRRAQQTQWRKPRKASQGGSSSRAEHQRGENGTEGSTLSLLSQYMSEEITSSKKRIQQEHQKQ